MIDDLHIETKKRCTTQNSSFSVVHHYIIPQSHCSASISLALSREEIISPPRKQSALIVNTLKVLWYKYGG